MIDEQEWISLEEAAALVGYNRDYFRRCFCDKKAPIVVIRERRSKEGKRVKIWVLKVAVLTLLESEIRQPA